MAKRQRADPPSRPWFKFHRGEWLGSHRLRACSIEARGLWADVLAASDPDGYVRVAEAVLAAVAMIPVERLKALLGELEERGVLHRGTGGLIVIRTIARDHGFERAGRKGGLLSVKNKGGSKPGFEAHASKLRASGSGSSSGSDSDPETPKGEGTSKPGGTPATRAWNAAFRKVRGAEYGWAPSDFPAIAAISKFPGGTPAEVTRRALKLLRSEDPWLVKRHTPRGLRDEWNRWPPEKPDPSPEPPPVVHPEVEDAIRSLGSLFSNGATP